ncbi:MAG TPA: hypothetical protein VIC08_16290 [Cellvibrionaceae bacterium]
MSAIHKHSLLATILAMALLAGCGGSKTTIDGDHVGTPDGHDDEHDHEHEGEHESVITGRLLINAADSQIVYVLDAEDGDIVAELSVPATPSALYPSPDYRFASVIARNDNWVSFINGGLSLEDHGDHQDLVVETPALMDFYLDGVRPTHYTLGEDQVAVFYDGNGELGEPAGVAVFTSATIASNGEPLLLTLDTHQHGAAQARGEHLLATVRDPATESTLPDRVGLYHQHGDHFDHEKTFEETCPGLHGSAQTEDLILFGCTDGVLVIDESQDFSEAKIANPESFSEGMRIGSLYAHHHVEQVIGVATGQYFVVDSAANTISPLVWSAAGEADVVARGFADGGELFVLLQANGSLTVLDAHDWDEVGSFSVIAEGETASEDAAYTLIVPPMGDVVYVLDTSDNHVHVIDLEHREVEHSWHLDFTPTRGIWLGVEGGEEHAH